MTTHLHTILCVDDDPDDRHLLEEAFHTVAPEHRIVEASDGLEALELLAQMKAEHHLPCLIVLDINMPKMDGRQTLSAIQQDEGLAHIPTVIFSTSSSELDRLYFQKRRVEYITKPVDFHVFVEVAEKLLSFCKYPS